MKIVVLLALLGATLATRDAPPLKRDDRPQSPFDSKEVPALNIHPGVSGSQEFDSEESESGHDRWKTILSHLKGIHGMQDSNEDDYDFGFIVGLFWEPRRGQVKQNALADRLPQYMSNMSNMSNISKRRGKKKDRSQKKSMLTRLILNRLVKH